MHPLVKNRIIIAWLLTTIVAVLSSIVFIGVLSSHVLTDNKGTIVDVNGTDTSISQVPGDPIKIISTTFWMSWSMCVCLTIILVLTGWILANGLRDDFVSVMSSVYPVILFSLVTWLGITTGIYYNISDDTKVIWNTIDRKFVDILIYCQYILIVVVCSLASLGVISFYDKFATDETIV